MTHAVKKCLKVLKPVDRINSSVTNTALNNTLQLTTKSKKTMLHSSTPNHKDRKIGSLSIVGVKKKVENKRQRKKHLPLNNLRSMSNIKNTIAKPLKVSNTKTNTL